MSAPTIPDDQPIPARVLVVLRDMFKAGRPVPQIAEATGLSEARVERLGPLPPKLKATRR